eukprot:1426297-Pyramimonas_sp.AAC.1
MLRARHGHRRTAPLPATCGETASKLSGSWRATAVCFNFSGEHESGFRRRGCGGRYLGGHLCRDARRSHGAT